MVGKPHSYPVVCLNPVMCNEFREDVHNAHKLTVSCEVSKQPCFIPMATHIIIYTLLPFSSPADLEYFKQQLWFCHVVITVCEVLPTLGSNSDLGSLACDVFYTQLSYHYCCCYQRKCFKLEQFESWHSAVAIEPRVCDASDDDISIEE